MARDTEEKLRGIDLSALIPEPGDMVTLLNCGTHIEVMQQRVPLHGLQLTEDEIACIRQGRMVWH